jgi:hypothetical protein
MSKEDDWVRKSILEKLYEVKKQNPSDFYVSRSDLIQFIGVTSNLIDFNALFLEEKELIHRRKTYGGDFVASVTVNGIELIEHGNTYRDKYSFMTVNNLNISGDVTGQVIQAVSSTLTGIQNISNSFNEARKAVDSVRARFNHLN